MSLTVGLSLIVTIVDQRVVWVSESVAEYVGLSADQLTGRPLFDLLDCMTEEWAGLFDGSDTSGQRVGRFRVQVGDAESIVHFELRRVRYVDGGRNVMIWLRQAPPSDLWHSDAGFVDEVRAAMLSGDIFVAYQPIIDMRSGQLKKLEALARWTHPELGVVTPDVFIPWAERSGVIDELGEWIFERACRDIVKMDAEGIHVDLSVNVSVIQLRHLDVAQRFGDVMTRTQLTPFRVWIEVTESVLMDADALSLLMSVHALGVRLVIDDFGTGHANFDYLTRLVVDSLKIDTSFVAGLGTELRATAIVRSVVGLGRELGLEIVAEGVESEAQRSQLLDLSCRFGQGWLFSPALAYDDLVAKYAPEARSRSASVDELSTSDETMRLSVLRSCRILDTDPEVAFDSLADLASQLLSAPIALITLVDADRQWFKARCGTELTELSRPASPCPSGLTHPEEVPLIVVDTGTRECTAVDALMAAIPEAGSFVSMPLRSREGLPLGTFSVVDTRPRTFTQRELGHLALLADQVSELLDLRRRTVELDDLYIGARQRSTPRQSLDDLPPTEATVEPGNGALAELARVAGRRAAIPLPDPNSLQFDGLTLDLANRTIAVDGKRLDPPAREFDLLAFLAARPGQVFTRSELLEHVWNSQPEWQDVATVTEHIHRLRTKIEADSNRPAFLRTIRGKGYSFEAPSPAITAPAVSHAGTWVHVDGRVVAADEGMVAMLAARTPADLIGCKVDDFVAPRSLQAVRAGREMRTSGVAPGPQLVTLRGLDGTERLCLISTDGGEFGGGPAVIGSALEIVDAPRLMRQMVSGVVAEVSDAVVVTDPDLRVLSWNPAAARLYGWSEPEVLGHNFRTLVGDDTLLDGGTPWNQLHLNGSWTGVTRQRARDGSSVTVVSSVNMLREHGGVTGIAVVNRPTPGGHPADENTDGLASPTSAARGHSAEQARLEALAACRVLDMSPDTAFDSLTRLAARLMETPIAAVSLVDRDRQWFKSTVGLELTGTPRDLGFSSLAIAHPDEVFVINDTALDERFANSPFVTGSPFIRSLAAMPICSREGYALGTLNVIDTTPREFTDDQIHILKQLALQAATLLDLRRRSIELDELIGERAGGQSADVHVTADVGDLSVHLSGGTSTITEVRRQSLTTAAERTTADPEASTLRLAAARALLRAEAVEEAVGVVIALVRDLGGSTIPARLDDRNALLLDCSFGHGEPLLARPDSVLARLRIERVLPGVLEDAREAIGRLRQRDDFAELANTDSLTGLLNRRAVDQLLPRLRPDDAVVIIDLDHFKGVNDRWGHAGGDEVLIAFARALRSHQRPGDQLGRLGGDELVAVLFGIDRAGLHAFLERVHASWLTVRPHEVTYSAGAALVGHRTGAEALHAADKALYGAKALGRDLTAVEPSQTPPGEAATEQGVSS